MKPVIILRGWYYFRVGHSAYLSMFIGLIQFLFVAILYLQRIPEFADLRLFELAVIFFVPYLLIATLVGYVHVKKQLNTDNTISTIQNPFLYSILPGKEAKISYPAMLLNFEVSKRFLKSLNLMDPNLEARFREMEQLINRLLAGEVLK